MPSTVRSALLTTLVNASGTVGIGIAVLFQRLTAERASMSPALPEESRPAARLTAPSSARSNAPLPTTVVVSPRNTLWALPSGAPARP